MKSLFGVAIILVSAPCARAYIEESPMGRQTSPFSVTDWSPKSFAPKIRIRPMGESQPKEDEQINVDAAAEGIIRREYGAWSKRYDKETSTQRFQIFKRNFVKQMEMNRKNGEFFLLNQYGDLTEDEYLAHLRKEQENEKNRIDVSEDTNVWENNGETLPAAPIKQIEDLTKEVLQAAMEASRKSVAQEQTSKRAKLSMYTKMLSGNLIQRENSMSDMVYTYLVDSTLDPGARKFYQRTVQSSAFPASYIDHLYTPMQQQDEYVRLPALLSLAITPSLETIKTYLVEGENVSIEKDIDHAEEWDKYAYAFSVDDSEEYYYE